MALISCPDYNNQVFTVLHLALNDFNRQLFSEVEIVER